MPGVLNACSDCGRPTYNTRCWRCVRSGSTGRYTPSPGLSEHVDTVLRREQAMALLGMIVTGTHASEWQLRRWANEALACLRGDPIGRPEGRVIRLP